jgi:integrase
VTLVGSSQVWGTPKGHEKRDVPIPRFLVDQLAEHVRGKAPDDLVFSGVRAGGALRAPIFRRASFDSAAEVIGMPGLHPHELRHTAASLAIAAGADVKVVQKMLGHKSATMTLDQYGHLFDDRLDEIADRPMRLPSPTDTAPRASNVRPRRGDREEPVDRSADHQRRW